MAQGAWAEGKFNIGERIWTVSDIDLKVRDGPGLSSAINDSVIKGTTGKIIEGPISQDNYSWWRIEYDIGAEGWSAENWLEKAPTVLPQPSSDFSRWAEEAIEWGENHTNSTNWWEEVEQQGYCLRFVANAFMQKYVEGQSVWNSALEAASQLYRFDQEPGGWANSPRGAVILFDKEGKNNFGHVGIYLGDGRILHAHGSVQNTTIEAAMAYSDVGRYLGWSYPSEKWKPGFAGIIRSDQNISSNQTRSTPDQGRYQISDGRAMGIDVSDHQGIIDWANVSSKGYKFAFIKATEGEGWTGDSRARQNYFEANMLAASSAGMLVGAYHFARPDLGNNATDEARWFINITGKYTGPGYLRPVLDIEKSKNATADNLTEWISEWMETVEREAGVEPIIYTSASFAADNKLDPSLNRFDLWVAHWTYDLNQSPDIGFWSEWDFWQFSNKGNVAGIKGDVDLDLFSGSLDQLSNYLIAESLVPKVDEYSVNITIFNPAGLPATDSAIIIDSDSNYTTNLRGQLRVLLPDGNHTINASKPVYGIGNWSGYINHTVTSSINITLRPVPKYPFLISAVNSANFSLEGADIIVDGIPKGKTGTNGDIRIELTDGNHTITANMSGYGSGNWTGVLDHTSMDGVVVKLIGALQYPFSVTVTNALGYLMEGANVSIDGTSKGSTDKNGEVRVMLTEGRHAIEANKTDYGSGNWTGTLNYSQAREVAVRLNGPLEHPFNVTVVNSANYNVEGAVVSTGGAIKGATDRHGRLRLWMVEGNRTINATKAGYGSGRWTGYLNHTSMSGVVVQLNGSLEYPLNITVMNPARYTVPGADIRIDGKPAGITDGNGGFNAMLSEGNHTIEANRTGYSPGNWGGHFNHSLMGGLVIELGGSSIIMDQKPIDLCLVLDTSGSMDEPECNDTSKIESLKKAAQDTIAGFFFPGSANRIAVVSFSDVSSTISEFTNNYFEAYANVSLLYAGGATSFGLGLSQAVYEFDRTNRTYQVPVILFMSDGMHNTPPEFGYYIAQCMFKGIRVFTVGYGAEADHDLLKEMALFSGGEYLYADPCGDENSQIQNAFIRLQMSLSGWQNVMNASGAVAQNQTLNATSIVVPPDSQYMIVNVVYPGSHLIVNLVDPNGNVVDPKDYIYTEDKRVITLRLKDPVPGEYTVQVFGDQVEGMEPFTVYFSSEYIAPEIPDVSIGSIVIKETSGQRLLEHPVNIPFDSRSYPSDVEEDGSDINIFDQNGREIPRWIESWNATARKGSIWVKVPEIPAGGEVRLRLLTGNPGAPAENNGSNIFPFFDDFEDGSIDLNKWSISSSPSARVGETNGTLHIYADEKSNSSADISSMEAFSPNVALRFRANVSKGQGSDFKGMGFLEGNIDLGQESTQDGVYWLGQEKNLFVRHKYSARGMSTQASSFRPLKSKYDAEYKIWQIKWLNSSIEYDLDGSITPSQPKSVGIPEQPINIGFSINTTYQAYPSEILLDWVLAYTPATTGPKVTVEREMRSKI